MTQVFVPDEEETQSYNGDSKMQSMAKQEIQFHTQPLPEAEPPAVHPFPAGLMQGLFASVITGSMAGLIFGLLLKNNSLVIPGWEALYSMGPFTFVAFWTLIGVALGLLIGGVAAILLAPAPVEEDRQIEGGE